ncbi:hypothetical protein OEZ60_00565 [Defluviimonas sp. WL0024]|uniref:Uncharacterized protein n=2 Tax=Albidovulum TaxID=205889 RepID=A0ABT3IXB9_9RHOB|nr:MULTISPECIES: hypothetical protein [Defluviimonas]MCU9846496.1 hypothetical protein [Defluviimonas sp. WL0024]MCW3780076.1 hypothetical protein [Defluviimonas salinarum]
MTCYLGDQALGHTNLCFDVLDGGMKKVENEDRSIKGELKWPGV